MMDEYVTWGDLTGLFIGYIIARIVLAVIF